MVGASTATSLGDLAPGHLAGAPQLVRRFNIGVQRPEGLHFQARVGNSPNGEKSEVNYFSLRGIGFLIGFSGAKLRQSGI
ncbi:MAG TPA: hypothetical protein VHU91_10270 [Mycobacteriales bacterium]|jgi:hypothetical protein|nr:hypothetical protein [Mycobacteriales bacterium]